MQFLRNAKRIAYALISVLTLVVIFQNLEQTEVELLFALVNMPLALLLAITLALGFLLGFSANAIWHFRHRPKKPN
ncbi:MAG: hypothetical protein KatS3mg111_1599 [Pirellulaceae bacterium]|nr:MAG: hypothetical protein KatS3mg111_1599 [Pirellulaceae bacterium]